MAEPRPAGIFVDFGLGFEAFQQEDHAPSICCNERDRWSAWGPAVQAGAGWHTGRWFGVMLDAKFAKLHADYKEEGDLNSDSLDFIELVTTLGVDLYTPTGPIFGTFGLGFTGGIYDGTFASHQKTDYLFGPQLRAGLYTLVSEHIALGVKVRYTRNLITNPVTNMAFKVTYLGL